MSEKIPTLAIGIAGAIGFGLVMAHYWEPSLHEASLIALLSLGIACAARLKAMSWGK